MPRTPSRAAAARPELLTSPENGTVRQLLRLAHRRRPGEILLEGPLVVAEAVAAGLSLELLAVREGDAFMAPAARRVVIGRSLFNQLSQTVTPQGVLAVARREPASVQTALDTARAAGWPLVVVDGVQDPGNVGAICRSAAASGAPAVAVLPGSADPFGPKAVRASAGTVFRLAVAAGVWSELSGVPGWGAAAHGGADLCSAPIEDGSVLVLGSESHGLSRQDLRTVTIPMAPGVESLNVAAAAAVLLFEIRRRKAA